MIISPIEPEIFQEWNLLQPRPLERTGLRYACEVPVRARLRIHHFEFVCIRNNKQIQLPVVDDRADREGVQYKNLSTRLRISDPNNQSLAEGLGSAANPAG